MDTGYRYKRSRLKGRGVAKRLKKIGLTEKVYPSDSNFLLVKVKDANKIYNI